MLDFAAEEGAAAPDDFVARSFGGRGISYALDPLEVHCGLAELGHQEIGAQSTRKMSRMFLWNLLRGVL